MMDAKYRRQRIRELYDEELQLIWTRAGLKRFPNQTDHEKRKLEQGSREIELKIRGVVNERNKHKRFLGVL
jgi:hypothetical protein